MQILPITNEPNQRFSTVLNGTELKFHFWYQDIGTGWFFDLATVADVPIISGARMNSMAPMLISTRMDFEGDIIPVATFQEELGEEPWGNTHQLVYFTPEEIAAL